MKHYLKPAYLLARTPIIPSPPFRTFTAKELRDHLDGWQSQKDLASLRVMEITKELKRRKLKV